MKIVTRIGLSLVALIAALARIAFPDIHVDLTTFIFIMVGILPWMTDIIDTAEFPGGWKFKFRTFRETAKKAEDMGLASYSLNKTDEEKYSFQLVGPDDPNLALAGLRIEIDKRLINIAEDNDISTNRQGLGSLLNVLFKRNLIGVQERTVIADLVGLLNSAVHGAKVSRESADFALDFGLRLLKNLDERTPPTASSREGNNE